MERESFEDPDVARLMNEHFVSVKVDREERPDVDHIYMQAVQSMTGHGGWPMTVFLTPDGAPFYGGTYFPPTPRHGLPSFPQLLHAIARSMVQKTLTKMARGGMYDQLGGGFHRYSVDAHWLVPHFEKMLYDNAQLATLYLHGWQAFGDDEYRRICEETLDYVLREMRGSAGGFYSAQDA